MPPNLEDWTFSVHALERCLDMALEPGEIRRCLVNPETITPCGPNYPPNTKIYACGRFAFAVDAEEREVITALWRGDVYDRSDDERFWRDR